LVPDDKRFVVGGTADDMVDRRARLLDAQVVRDHSPEPHLQIARGASGDGTRIAYIGGLMTMRASR